MLHQQPCDLLILVLSLFAFSARVPALQLLTFCCCLQIQGLMTCSVATSLLVLR